MEFKDLVLKTRSYRRFDASVPIDRQTLLDLIELARCSPSAANRQPLKYVLSCEPDMNAKIFSTLGWAGYLPEWPGPEEQERPTAYIVVTMDRSIVEESRHGGHDVGIAAQSILLGAVDKGFGGCMFGNVKKSELKEMLDLPDSLEIDLVIALGKPVEKVVLEDVKSDGSIKYHRDAEQTHYVPKRKIDELVLKVYS
jgi:nitroreductase